MEGSGGFQQHSRASFNVDSLAGTCLSVAGTSYSSCVVREN